MSKMKISAIDFGTSKIVTIIGKLSNSERVAITGAGTVPYDGYQDGDWNTPGQMIQRVRDSISAAELESKTHITEMYVGVPGEYIRVRCAESAVEIAGETVSYEDMLAAQDAAAEELNIAEMGGMVLHRSVAWYQVDDGVKSMEPKGSGRILKAMTSFVIADEQYVSDISEILGTLGNTILGFLSSTLGETLLLTSVEDRNRKVVLIDCGYLSTEISVLEGEAMIYHAMLPMGGGHLTADIATEFGIPMRSAERIKRSYIFNRDEFDRADEHEVYDASGRKVVIHVEDVDRRMERSMKDLCDMIDMTLSNDVEELLGARSTIYLTGGGLKMMGAREFLEAKIGRPIVARNSRPGKLNMEIFDSVQGLLDITADSIDDRSHTERSGFGSKMTGFLRKK